MVMDADLGGRREKERKGEERIQEMSKEPKQIYQIFGCSI